MVGLVREFVGLLGDCATLRALITLVAVVFVAQQPEQGIDVVLAATTIFVACTVAVVFLF